MYQNMIGQGLDHLAHATLLVSPDTLSGQLMALCLAKAALGLQAHTSHFNADIYQLPAEGEQRIVVADIDTLAQDIVKRPSKGTKKFYILNHAESMSAQVQNKLLKTLEEPQEGVYLMVNTASKHAMLAPVQSRCRHVYVQDFGQRVLAEALAAAYPKVTHQQIALAATLSKGRLGEAQRFLNDKKKLNRFELVLQTLLSTHSSKDVLAGVATLSAFKEHFIEAVDYIELLLRDALVLHVGTPQLITLTHQIESIKTLATMYSVAAIERILPFLNTIRRRKVLNANLNSMADELMFYLAQSKVLV